MSFNAETVKGFTLGLLAAKYDNPKPIPIFHEEMWEACCSTDPKVAIAAPRGHAKSTAITHAYILACVCFRIKSFVLLVSDTESQAVEFLGDIRAELEENEALRQTFGIKLIVKSNDTNIIVMMNDGHKFRIIAKGSEQKIRGIKWLGKRPDLIVGDDLENDEIVMNPERREKFRKWFMKALLPCGSDDCWVRIVGTILHLDSMLQRLLEDKTWKHLFYEACDGQFESILWPEQFSSERLRGIYEGYLAQGDPEGFSQEYRNSPVSIEDAFFNKDYFIDFERTDKEAPILPNLEYFAAADFAISEKERADKTAIIVGGMSPEGTLYIVDMKTGKWDSDAIIDELLITQKAYNINMWTFETEKVDKAIGPFLNREMHRRRIYMNIHKETPGKSKIQRARSIQGMHKSRAIRYDKEASWWPDFYAELMMVSGSGPRGKHDDQFDAFAYLGKTIDMFFDADSDEEIENELYDEEWETHHDQGRSAVTGY